LSQAFSEAEQPAAKRSKTEPFDPRALTEAPSIDDDDDDGTWVIFVGNVSVGAFST
jgi:hypothetical protein